ncbi:MAG TPA: hypothetical protein EYN14_07305 [Alphaproteobacteria bacterium]|nr:hypothetical protein [Alphaproteobacteria bacterium]
MIWIADHRLHDGKPVAPGEHEEKTSGIGVQRRREQVASNDRRQTGKTGNESSLSLLEIAVKVD